MSHFSIPVASAWRTHSVVPIAGRQVALQRNAQIGARRDVLVVPRRAGDVPQRLPVDDAPLGGGVRLGVLRIPRTHWPAEIGYSPTNRKSRRRMLIGDKP
jgi:hypothetical protein